MSWESLEVKLSSPLSWASLKVIPRGLISWESLKVKPEKPHVLRIAQSAALELPWAEDHSKCCPKALSARISQSELPAALWAENLSKRSPLRLRISESESPRVLMSWESLEVKPVRPHELKFSGGEAPEVLWAENLSKSNPRNQFWSVSWDQFCSILACLEWLFLVTGD